MSATRVSPHYSVVPRYGVCSTGPNPSVHLCVSSKEAESHVSCNFLLFSFVVSKIEIDDTEKVEAIFEQLPSFPVEYREIDPVGEYAVGKYGLALIKHEKPSNNVSQFVCIQH